ncbi:MAG TPA: PAS domain S-box protein [Casimicrobiaceae bacterium]|nr:PAS domain S-box protein [Casimicrobiaceae bacterium]
MEREGRASFVIIEALIGLAIAALVLAFVVASVRIVSLTAAALLAGVAAVLGLLHLRRVMRERRAVGDDLRDAEARVSNIVEAAMDPIVTVDDAQRIVGFNAAAEQAFGLARNAVIGRSLDMLIPERYRAAHRRHVERFGATGVTSRRMGASVLSGLRADGHEFPIEASISQHIDGGRRFYTAILRDVSERTDAQTLLTRSEMRLRSILDSAMDAIITTDDAQNVVLFNNAAETMFGWSRAEALGAPLSRFIPERFRRTHGEHVARFGEAGTTSRRMGGSLRIVTGLRRDGEEFPIDASISQVVEGDRRFYTVILRDVTARVQTVEALRRSKDELQELGAAAHMTREQEKSRIARELHDELGQLLTMMQMDLAWCKDRKPVDNPAFAAKLDRMETLLKSTIAATRRISSDLRPLMLDDLGLVPSIEWLVENFSQRTGIRCELSVAQGDLGLAMPEATAVFRIVQESLTNIAKHAKATRADITIARDGDLLVVRIEDDGIGFSPDAPRKPQSFGLFGLRERASLIKADVVITSAPGAGTSVELRLPREAAVASP